MGLMLVGGKNLCPTWHTLLPCNEGLYVLPEGASAMEKFKVHPWWILEASTCMNQS